MRLSSARKHRLRQISSYDSMIMQARGWFPRLIVNSGSGVYGKDLGKQEDP